MLLLIILYGKCLGDGTTANDHVTLIQNYCLTGGNGTLGLVKHYTDPAAFFRINGSLLLVLAVAGFCGDMHGLR